MQFQLVCKRKEDGRWIAEIEAIPGVLAYGTSMQKWEQSRRSPSGAAQALIRIASKYPKVVREALA